jgi:site-specific recombinase XerD
MPCAKPSPTAPTHRSAHLNFWLDPVTGLPLSPNQVSKAFQALVTVFVSSPQGRAVHAERITLHGARHSFVTNLLAAGVPMATVSKLAGHASVAFTVSRYGHLDEHADQLPVMYQGVAA